MKPLILDYKVQRTEPEAEASYYYDPALDLNVVQVAEQTLPFIDVDDAAAELMTKTKADDRERDDHHRDLLELMTKTLVNRESDERSLSLVELMTKTRVFRESDDEHFIDN